MHTRQLPSRYGAALATALAHVGLLMDSPPVIIGAMLISPLLGPIMGFGFGVAIFELALLRRAAKALGGAQPGQVVSVQLTEAPTLLAIGGLLLTAGLLARGWKSAIILGIAATAAGAYLAGVADPPRALVSIPDPSGTFLQMDIRGALGLGLLQVVFVFFFVDLFDTVGTLVGLGHQAKVLTPEGELPRAQQALLADSAATMAGAALGTSTVTSYIESAAGVTEGGRTGLTAVAAGVLFALAVFFSPLAAAIPGIATAPALIVVGSLMMRAALAVAWDDPTEAIPAFLTIIGMPLTFSIANGLALGFIAYPAVKLVAGRGREMRSFLYVFVDTFIGGGLGVAWNRLDPMVFTFPGLDQTTTTPGGDRTNFAWRAGAGVSIPLDARLSLDLSWRYMDLGRVGTDAGDITVRRSTGTSRVPW